jgi:hypothetical protein
MSPRVPICPENTLEMPWRVERGEDYGSPVDAVIADSSLLGFTREDFLKLAWAALDQAVCRADMPEARKAFEAIANLLPETDR